MDLYKELPEMAGEFELKDFPGNLTKVKYTGKFKCKIPNLAERTRSDKIRAELCAGMEGTLRADTLEYNRKLAYLQVVLTDYPQWWKKYAFGAGLMDGNVVGAIYDKVAEFEENWVKGVWGDMPADEEDEQAASSEE